MYAPANAQSSLRSLQVTQRLTISPTLCRAGLRKVIVTHFCLGFSRYFLTYFHFQRPSLLPATTKLLRERHKLLAALGMPEEVAFNLGNDEISDVFADNNGYYILKCLNTYMESESEANKEKVARQRKTERFHAIYSDLMEDTISEFQQRMWDNIKFTDYDTVTTSNFFEVYQEYFE